MRFTSFRESVYVHFLHTFYNSPFKTPNLTTSLPSATLTALISHVEASNSTNPLDADDITWLNIYKVCTTSYFLLDHPHMRLLPRSSPPNSHSPHSSYSCLTQASSPPLTKKYATGRVIPISYIDS